MKVSLNWVREFTDIKLPVEQLVEKIGAQLGAVEEVVDIGKKYKGIVVAKVVFCQPHPNADKLKVCKIDDHRVVKNVRRDAKGLVQVVCGAPNAREGLLAAWIPPGTTVPATADKDPLKLEAREIRGEMSNGMLASAHELDIGDDHSGIVEIENTPVSIKKPNSRSLIPQYDKIYPCKPGMSLIEALKLDDFVIDIENKMFTHRPDCFGQLGVAREIAGIIGNEFISPPIYFEPKTTGRITAGGLKLEIKNELPKLVPRFMAQTFENVVVKPSPLKIQSYLARVGIRPINNIVDITNYFMVLTGQPLHAYDYDKVMAKDPGAKHATITIRYPKRGETITLLGGKEIKPHHETIMIASKTKVIGIGGVMGGADTEVDENTKNIILECANFDMYSIRKTAMEHGLFTDAVTRFTKGQSPLQCERVLAWAEDEIICQTGATPGGTIYDNKHGLKTPEPIKVTPKFINDRLGLNLSAQKISQLLENVEFKAMPLAGNYLGITPPFWRTDIHIPEDVVEEVGRLYGYDHLRLELPKRGLTPVKPEPMLEFKNRLSELLSSAGANELLTYSFVPSDLMQKAGQNPANAFKISNALSPDLQYYRMSLVPSLLDKVHPNIKSGFGEFALFEINQTHAKDLIGNDGLPVEEYRLGLVFAAEPKTAKNKYRGAAYYQAKKYLSRALDALNIEAIFEPMSAREPKLEVGKAAAAPFERQRSAYVMSQGGQLLGEIGEFKPSVTSKFKLPAYCAGFELDAFQLLNSQNNQSNYTPVPRFPKVQQDISLKVPTTLSYGQLFNFIQKHLAKLQPPNTFFTLSPVDIYADKENKTSKHITLRLEIASYKRTLTAEEVNSLLDGVAALSDTKLGAQRL